jgi:hypothetical protein
MKIVLIIFYIFIMSARPERMGVYLCIQMWEKWGNYECCMYNVYIYENL